ncbi:uncharacterized protein UV8b_03938 [Ustilaginoidea virens]|uniref:ELMO domain-containing protein n=1 Tax=Ustilaginoidea virens TaxID=1159556 RepID=A0A063BWF2_USTVR|nr:uncharacterized protein UV8b_03938 [Ustilaginoidea virens]QUC19697.1 hypothetical protein UV8b_03938 [Ustilaginoidea virens]GAO13834.1 hypothetical protein UVI_02004450 [Ustilaginoidea virens]
MDQGDIPALLARLASDEDAARKMAVFKLQTSINDPSFADVFISSGGLVVLRGLIMESGGNTLAYSLQSLTRLLEVDMGWDIFQGPSASAFVERIVELVVINPLVNILRGAMSILVALVSRSRSDQPTSPAGPANPAAASFGFRALKPAVAVYPQFFELVVQQLQSADHALCANALMLVNALIRDSILHSETCSGRSDSSDGGEDWAKLVKRLQDLGLVKAVYRLMQSSAIQDLAYPVLEFQTLTKMLLRKWREVEVDPSRREHRRALKGIHGGGVNGHSEDDDDSTEASNRDDRKRSPNKWRRLGFETESPAQEFEATGYLGVMDLADYVARHGDGFQKLLLEQTVRPLEKTCPVARASLAVTVILYEHFEVDRVDVEDSKGYQGLEAKDHDRLFRPLLLEWSRLHSAALLAFFRLWKATSAELADFDKVAELVRILVGQVVGRATRAKDISEAEDEMLEVDITQLRRLQTDLLDRSFDDAWGQYLYQVRETLKQEALQFVKEQRVRCMLQGSWFYKPASSRKTDQAHSGQAHNGQAAAAAATATAAAAAAAATAAAATTRPWRFARLSYNRRYLHYADFEHQMAQDPGLDVLTNKIDLGSVSSVGSNVSAADDTKSDASGSAGQAKKTTTKITIYAAEMKEQGGTEEYPVLSLRPVSPSLASEWLDGLLMLLNQAPITAETSKLINLIIDYGLKMRLLNVRLDAAFAGPPAGAGAVPSRAGLDEDYFFEV